MSGSADIFWLEVMGILPFRTNPIDKEAFNVGCLELTGRLESEFDILGRRPLGRRQSERLQWLRVECYNFLRPVIFQPDWHSLFAERIALYGHDILPRRGARNPFQLGLIAIFAHRLHLLTHQERELLGKQLWYACRHFIPPHLLVPFITSVGTSKIRAKADSNEIESAYTAWIIAGLQASDAPVCVIDSYSDSFKSRMSYWIEGVQLISILGGRSL